MISKLNFVGDLCLTDWKKNSSSVPSTTCRRWLQLIKDADLTIANLECCLIENGSKCERFVAVPQSECDVFAKSGIDVFTLGNNHIMDCGESSLYFTRSYLRNLGIETVGAGENIAVASAPLIITKNGKKIGIISSTDATHYKATKHQAGISPLSLKRIKKSIQDIHDDVDLVILCIHSDLEFTNYPAPWKVRLSRRLALAGADIIIHHHPHTLQGIEIYKGTLIAYSLGSFIFPIHGREYMVNRGGHIDEGTILEVNVDFTSGANKHISYNLIPTIIGNNNVTRLADNSEAENILCRMTEYSDSLTNLNILRKKYLRLCLKQARNFILGTYYTMCRNGLKCTYKYLHTHLATRMHRNWMRGILTLGWF